MPQELLIPGSTDAHTMATLTDAYRRLPYVPQQINALPWNAQGVTTRTVLVEARNETFDLIDERAYNSGMSQVDLGKADVDAMESLVIPHYPHGFTIHASEVSERRAFGSTTQFEMTEDRQARFLQTWQTSIDFTWEFTRIGGGLFGVILDRHGNVRYDLRKKFKRQPLRLKFNFGSGDNFFKFINGAKFLARQALGNMQVADWQLIGDKPMNDKVIYDPTIQKSYEGFQERQFQRADNSKGFTICDDVEVKLYRNARIPRTDKLAFPTKVLALIPNAPGLFQSRFAPAQTFSSINDVGAPVYLTPAIDDFDEYIAVKGQTNIVSWCQRYEGIVLIEHGPTTDLEALGYYGQAEGSVYDDIADLTAEQLGLGDQDVGNPTGLEEAIQA